MQLTALLPLIPLLSLLPGATPTLVRIHSLNHCRNSAVDLQCGHLKPNHCCSLGNNARALSIEYRRVKGRRIIGTRNRCKKHVYAELARTPARCIYDGVFTGGKYRNPLNAADTGEEECGGDCEGTSEPDEALVYGEMTFNIAAMSAEEVELLHELAGNGTAVAEWPEELTNLIVPTEE